MFLLLTNAEAFDRVSWPLLLATLKHIGLGEGMIAWIAVLYSNPFASVRMNNVTSASFPICNGTRHGCLLSAIIFTLNLELCTIRVHSSIVGLQAAATTHILSAFANDLIFFITSPHLSISPLLVKIQWCCNLSNFKIIQSKIRGYEYSNAHRKLLFS